MDGLKKIMYGVTDFPLMRRENAYFVDRTALIPELEKTRYALFFRPRRFGKSLLCAILQCYCDIDYAGRFKELFGGLDIGKNPTEEHGKYLMLMFKFSMVEKTYERVVQAAFGALLFVGHGPYLVRRRRMRPDSTSCGCTRTLSCRSTSRRRTRRASSPIFCETET